MKTWLGVLSLVLVVRWMSWICYLSSRLVTFHSPFLQLFFSIPFSTPSPWYIKILGVTHILAELKLFYRSLPWERSRTRLNCHPAYLTYMQSTSCKMPSWMNHKLESRLPREISATSDNADDTALMAERVKEESKKSGLKLSIQKMKIMAFNPITSWQTEGKKVETMTDFIFLGSKITANGDCSHEIKRRLLLGRKAMTNLVNVLKSRDITLLTKVPIVKVMVFLVVMYGCEHWPMKKTECWRTDAFKLWCWRRLMRRPLDCNVIKQVNPKGNQPWIFTGRTDDKPEAPTFWPPDANS